MTREETFQQILLQLKRHLTNIESYYGDNDYDKTSIVVSAVRREQENIVSLVRQLMSYEDLLQRVYALTVEAKFMDKETELTIAGEDDTLPF